MEAGESGKDYLRLSILAAGFGLLAAVLTVVFLVLIDVTADFLSEDVPDHLGWVGSSNLWVLILALVCGLIVGLIYKRYGENSKLGRTQSEYEKEGKVEYRQLPNVIASFFVSLISGASVGPEGALVDLNGGIGTYLCERLKLTPEDIKILTLAAIAGCFGGFFGSPVVGAIVAMEYMFLKKLDYYRLIIPALVAAAVGYAGYYILLGTSLVGVFTFPGYDSPRLIDLFYAALLGLTGALLGICHMVLMQRSGMIGERLRSRPIQRALLGALAFGIIGMILPLTLYSGQTALEELFVTFEEKGVWVLLALLLGKMLSMSLSFASGFKGGPIFPLLFIGATFGMILSIVFPFIPVGVCILVLMTSFICVMWPIPVSVSLFLGLATQAALIPVIVIGAVVGFIVSMTVRSRIEKKKGDVPRAT